MMVKFVPKNYKCNACGLETYSNCSVCSKCDAAFSFEPIQKTGDENMAHLVKELNEDLINHPSHYHQGGIDVIGFAELHYSKEELKGFYRINCIKYIDRYDKKGGVSSLEKCKFYLNKLFELETGK